VNSLSNQELQVVQAFSSVAVPEEIIRSSDIKGLIEGMISSQRSSENAAQKLERLRQEKRDGNFFSNLWHNRNDKIQDAQIDLSSAIGNLTQKSSQLLIVNTAISKVLYDQQQILMQQQLLLEQQANELKEQNQKILDQQKTLEHQQNEINAANQGLLEAKGLTQEQAQQLVGCVVRVTEAEKRLDISNQELRSEVEQRQENLEEKLSLHVQSVTEKMISQDEAVQHLQENLVHRLSTQQQDILAIVDRNALVTSESLNAIEFKQKNFYDENTKAIEVLRDSVKLDFQHAATELEGHSDALKNTDAQLASLQQGLHKSDKFNRIALVAVACVALASLTWQIALYFAWV